MSIIPIIVKRRKSIVDKFAEIRAIDEQSAKLPEELGLQQDKDFEFLLSKGTLVKTQDEKFYLNEQKKFFK